MNWAASTWLVLAIIFLIVEGACPFHLVSIWFAAGSLVSMIAALLGAQLWLQIVLFVVISCGLLILLLPFVKKVISPKIVKTNVEAMEGVQGYVTAPIDNVTATGQVKLNGMEWSARSTSGQPISGGTLVKVDKIEGVKAFVSPVVVAQVKKEEEEVVQ